MNIYPSRKIRNGPVFIDGGEFNLGLTPGFAYWATESGSKSLLPGEFFPYGYVWRKGVGFADLPWPYGTLSQTAYMTQKIREAYPRYTSMGYSGFISDYWLTHPASELRQRVAAAMSQSDLFTWLYTETAMSFFVPEGQFDNGVAGATDEFVAAIRKAKNANPNKILFYEHGVFAQALVNNIDFFNTQPFDGITIYVNNISSGDSGRGFSYRGFTPQPFSEEELDLSLSPLEGVNLGNITFNLIRVYLATMSGNTGYDPILTQVDFFDDVGWANILQNFTNMSKVARRVGIKGYLLDNEAYSPWASYASTLHSGTKTLQEYQVQAKLRGRQLMRTILAEMPDAAILWEVAPTAYLWNTVTYDESLNTAFHTGMLAEMANIQD